MIGDLNHITLAVSDLDRSLSFYRHTLGFPAQVRWDGGAYLSVGSLWLCLSVDEPSAKTDYTHLAFSVSDSAFATCCERLRAAAVVEWKTNKSEGDSFYFLDPDGHKLELHVGNLHSRLKSLKQHPYSGLQWLND